MEQRDANVECSFCRKSYRDVGPLVEGPDDVYICAECAELCQSIIDQEKHRRGCTGSQIPSMRVETILERLDRLVRGEHQALVETALRHYERSVNGPQHAVLFIGPTRSSKIYLARALAHALGVPFAEGDAHGLFTSGSAKIEPLLHQLLDASNFDVAAAQRGVLYVDRADDQATQERLLRFWEGPRCAGGGHGLQIDVDQLLLICGGQFAGLDTVIAPMGRHPEQPVVSEALLRFGMSPAVVRRFQVIVQVAPLDEPTMARVASYVDFERMEGGRVERVAAADRPAE
jgi:ATP-dependent Clp protease ATP-binding subunit ClpX